MHIGDIMQLKQSTKIVLLHVLQMTFDLKLHQCTLKYYRNNITDGQTQWGRTDTRKNDIKHNAIRTANGG